MGVRRVSGVYRVIVAVLKPAMTALTRRDWRGGEHIPDSGGFIAVANHVSDLDPITFGHFLYDHGAPPHFLAKSSLFEVPVIGWFLRGARQIPVYRGTARAAESLVAAEAALAQGRCVAMFPEGTLTRDPELWPMTGHPGAARLALTTQVPVVPIAQWGAHRILPRYSLLLRPLPRKTVTVVAGPPVDLSDLGGRPQHPDVLGEATDRIMAAVSAQLADIRGEAMPEHVWDLRSDGDPDAGQNTWAGRRAAAMEGRIVTRRLGVRRRLSGIRRRRD